MAEADVTGMTVEVEHSCKYYIKLCPHVTGGSRGAV